MIALSLAWEQNDRFKGFQLLDGGFEFGLGTKRRI